MLQTAYHSFQTRWINKSKSELIFLSELYCWGCVSCQIEKGFVVYNGDEERDEETEEDHHDYEQENNNSELEENEMPTKIVFDLITSRSVIALYLYSNAN